MIPQLYPVNQDTVKEPACLTSALVFHTTASAFNKWNITKTNTKMLGALTSLVLGSFSKGLLHYSFSSVSSLKVTVL